ncbi:MAG: hypothetical protein JF593_06595 [Novosphingobium sp.]|nr:hypothetical protein [Novosphingobium sp.]
MSPRAVANARLHGFGNYHETYVRLDVGWRLKATQLTRLRLDMLQGVLDG